MKKGISGIISQAPPAQPDIDMFLNVCAGIVSSANPTWTAFGTTGYETASVNPGDEASNVMSVAGTIDKLRVHIRGSIPVTAPMIITIYKSTDHGATWSATTLTCTVTNPAIDASDTTHSFTVAAGDLIAIAYLRTSGTGTPAPICAVRFTAS